jgi:AcrR family transcriptional regulator
MSAPTRTPRSNWIEEGLRALAAGGPEAVRIELLARALGVTRGGFYWHFEHRRALLEEILDAWERLSVDEVIERVESEGGDARAKLWQLSAIAASSDEPLRIGNHFIASDHGARSRADVLKLALRQLEA